MKRKVPRIGGHVSVAGGLYKAFENARAIAADCAQIFGASPRQWHAATPAPADLARYETAREKFGDMPIYLHAAYLVNLASPDAGMRGKSVKSMIDHLRIAEALRAVGLIFHVGSGKGAERKRALDEEVAAIMEILKNVPGKTQLIMENTAGGGDKIGDVEDIAYLFRKAGSRRLKVCYDTAHGFEAGLIPAYAPAAVRELCRKWDAAIGLENIVVMHANDSKTASGSHHDRHENIGVGEIGLAGFRALAAEPRLQNKDWLLEVPGFAGAGPDKKNMEILRKCFA